MSKRRKIGDTVFVSSGAGFGSSSGEFAVIPDTPGNRDEDVLPCFFCDDPLCHEWSDVWTLEGNQLLCHVYECQMFDTAGGVNLED
jgi:hypothetical protein